MHWHCVYGLECFIDKELWTKMYVNAGLHKNKLESNIISNSTCITKYIYLLKFLIAPSFWS